jgi:RluA family pseudouridine synthase
LKPAEIELPGVIVPILFEDRNVLAIDKPAGWMLAPPQWDKTSRNLQRELMLSLENRDFWAVSRHVKFIRFVHRLDSETSGVLLLAKSAGALSALSELFETRRVQKKYLAVVVGIPKEPAWVCRLKISEKPNAKSQIYVDARSGSESETAFRVLRSSNGISLIEATPTTGRTHQIRVHLAESGHAIVGDKLYGGPPGEFGLRSVELSYVDPFHRRPVHVIAPTAEFLRRFHFA